MNKNYGLLMAIFIGFSGGLIASEDIKQSFVESTQQRLKDTAWYYGAGYGLAHGVATAFLAPMDALADAKYDIYCKTYGATISSDTGIVNLPRNEKMSFAEKASIFKKKLKQRFFSGNKNILATHRGLAPFVFGSSLALHTYNTLLRNTADKE